MLEQSFASSWIYGLVPPKTVTTTSRCPGGVAKVETHLSFVNQLVGLLTLGIYTPMHIRVTCAPAATPSTSSLNVPADAAEGAVRRTFGSAADLAAATRQPVLVRFTERQCPRSAGRPSALLCGGCLHHLARKSRGSAIH